MALIAIFGAGILVGTAMLIVMPEAVAVIIEADSRLKELLPDEEHEHDHAEGEHDETIVIDSTITTRMGLAVTIGFTLMLVID
jgi:hypothetical protein